MLVSKRFDGSGKRWRLNVRFGGRDFRSFDSFDRMFRSHLDLDFDFFLCRFFPGLRSRVLGERLTRKHCEIVFFLGNFDRWDYGVDFPAVFSGCIKLRFGEPAWGCPTAVPPTTPTASTA